MESAVFFVNKYGYLILFAVVMLEMVALPISGQATMAYSGFLAWQGKLNGFVCILVAGSAAMSGMTLAYFLGRQVGVPLIHKYGHLIHLEHEHLKKTEMLMDKYGGFTLMVAYYVPGIRHFTGYFSGINRYPLHKFALFSYSGAAIWAIVFVSLGRLLGAEWKTVFGLAEKYLLVGGMLSLIIFVGYFVLQKKHVFGK